MSINWDLAKTNIGFWAFGIARIPMLAFVGARFVELSDIRSVIKIPLGYRTKNHLGSMYFGAMAVGADVTIGGLALHLIRKKRVKVQMIFKDFKADYRKRAEADTLFVCDEGRQINEMIEEAMRSPDRINRTIGAYALVPDRLGEEPVATFELTLSLRNKP
jgi:acyl-coenzyme A thioesterase PaaI-like protein